MKAGSSCERTVLAGLVFAVVLPLLLASGCENDRLTGSGDGLADPSGTLLSAGSCKVFITDRAIIEPSLFFDCFEYSMETGGGLLLNHINAGLNCCPGTIQADISIEGRTITISEREGDDAEWCHCLCLYDIEYLFTGISTGRWTIIFKGPYTGDGPDLEGTVDIAPGESGKVCLERDIYPWNIGNSAFPSGELLYYFGCKEEETASLSSASAAGETCALFDYDGSTLFIRHSDAAFNCCLDGVEADIGIEGNMITITESEDPPGGYCDCICLYDLACIITALPPGIYQIRFVEPYLAGGDPALEFVADLTEPSSGKTCVPRDGYPWNGE